VESSTLDEIDDLLFDHLISKLIPLLTIEPLALSSVEDANRLSSGGGMADSLSSMRHAPAVLFLAP